MLALKALLSVSLFLNLAYGSVLASEEINSLMITALLEQNCAAILDLVRRGADPNTMFVAQTPLLIACRTGDCGAVRELLEANARAMSAAGDTLETRLQIAAQLNSKAMLDLLFEFGASDIDGMAFREAMLQGHVSILKRLLGKYDTYHLLRSHDRESDICYAIRRAHRDSIFYLLRQNYIRDWVMTHKWAVYQRVVDADDQELWCSLVKHPWYEELHDANGNAPLTSAVINDSSQQLLKILYTNVNINHANEEGKTALHYAVGRPFTVLILLAWGADPNLRDNAGNTPLMQSIIERNSQTCLFLLHQGGDANICNQDRFSPLVALIRHFTPNRLLISAMFRSRRFDLMPVYASAREALIKKTGLKGQLRLSLVRGLDDEYDMRLKLGMLLMARTSDPECLFHPSQLPRELSDSILSIFHLLWRM